MIRTIILFAILTVTCRADDSIHDELFPLLGEFGAEVEGLVKDKIQLSLVPSGEEGVIHVSFTNPEGAQVFYIQAKPYTSGTAAAFHIKRMGVNDLLLIPELGELARGYSAEVMIKGDPELARIIKVHEGGWIRFQIANAAVKLGSEKIKYPDLKRLALQLRETTFVQTLIKQHPVPGAPQREKCIRFGILFSSGFIIGSFILFFVVKRYFERTSRLSWMTIGVGALICGLLAVRHGDYFYYGAINFMR